MLYGRIDLTPSNLRVFWIPPLVAMFKNCFQDYQKIMYFRFFKDYSIYEKGLKIASVKSFTYNNSETFIYI
jgi:hypothetical protein